MLKRFVIVIGSVLLLALIVVLVAIVRAGSPAEAVVVGLNSTVGRPISTDPASVPFAVESGDSAATVADHLASHALIRSALAFRVIVRLEGLDPHLQAGTYNLRRDMSTTELASAIAQGRMAGGFLTIPEGWRVGEVADALDRAGIVPRADFVSYVAHPPANTGASAWPVPAGHGLEGYLFPDSYRFQRNTAVSEVVDRMVGDFDQRFASDLQKDIEAHGLTDYQGITLASIIEREAVLPSERPIIASVYYNRLRKGMKLQADPTVQYALGDDAQPAPNAYWKRTLTFANLASPSPYNTYQVTGLPPGPICSPGLGSIQAVARPASTDFLYFVAKPDGSHAFARTFEEQQQNVARYQP